jgi:hypothetical protein
MDVGSDHAGGIQPDVEGLGLVPHDAQTKGGRAFAGLDQFHEGAGSLVQRTLGSTCSSVSRQYLYLFY